MTTIEYTTIIKTVSITYILMGSEADDHKIDTMSIPLSFALRRQTFAPASSLLYQNDGNYRRFVYLMKMLIFLINKKTLCNVILSYTYINKNDCDLDCFVLFACFSLLFLLFFFVVSFVLCSK